MAEELKFQRPESVASFDKLKMGIYGENGIGKTTFLRTVPEEMPMLIISADDEGVKPLVGRKNTLVVKLDTWDKILPVYQFLASETGQKIQVVAFDTWTRIQVLAANKLIGYQALKPGEEAQYLSAAPKTPRGFETWQQIGALAAEWLRYFLRLNRHTIFLFQEANRESKHEGDPLTTGPALTPTALFAAKEALEILGRLYVEEDPIEWATDKSLRTIPAERKETRRLLLGKHPRFFAKGPSQKLGYTLEDPTFEKLLAAIQGA